MIYEIILIFSFILFLLSIYLYYEKENEKKILDNNFIYIFMLISGGLFIILLFNYYEFERIFFSYYEQSLYSRFYYYMYSKYNIFYDNIKFYSNKAWNYVDFQNNPYLTSASNFFYEALIFTVKCIFMVIKYAFDTFKMTSNYLQGVYKNETIKNSLNDTGNDYSNSK